jgi:aryl-alcohol dehydrogenase-like predicted oxidoreductase
MWAAMEALVEKGLVKSIGVSNFSVVKLQHILDVAKVCGKYMLELFKTARHNQQRDDGPTLQASCPP